MTMRTLTGILCCALLPLRAAAQTADARSWWISFGGGAATTNAALQMSAGAVYGTRFASSVLSVRIIGATNENPTVVRWSPSAATYKLTDYGILYGPAWEALGATLSVGAGLGLVRATVLDGSSVDTKSSVSLPVEAQALWRLTNFCGAGVYGYTSANGARRFSGLLLTVQLGVFHPGR